MRIEDVLAKVTLNLLGSGYIINRWRIEESDRVPTAGTDGATLYWNRKFFESLTFEEQEAVIVHELAHCLLLHPLRKPCEKETDWKRWTIAEEMVTNSLVVELGYNSLPGEPYDPFQIQKQKRRDQPRGSIYYYSRLAHGRTVRELYEMLKKIDEDELLEPEDHVVYGESSGETKSVVGKKEELEDAVTAAIQKITESFRKRGGLPASLERLWKKLHEPRINWVQKVLAVVATVISTDDIYWNRPNTRHPCSDDFVVPSWMGTKAIGITVVIDTSGSISDDDLVDFISELKGISQYVDEIDLISCDMKIQTRMKTRDLDPTQIKLIGGGGTDFRPVFETVKETDLMIFFTDGEGVYPEKRPPYRVIWVLTQDRGVPFGEKTLLKKDY